MNHYSWQYKENRAEAARRHDALMQKMFQPEIQRSIAGTRLFERSGRNGKDGAIRMFTYDVRAGKFTEKKQQGVIENCKQVFAENSQQDFAENREKTLITNQKQNGAEVALSAEPAQPTANIHVVPLDTVSALFAYGKGRTALLNFASFTHPGGGFLNGSRAQEECLCQESTLYEVLSAFSDSFYRENKALMNRSLYTDRLLYSPAIRFQHKESGREGREAERISETDADVITCAAPNLTSAQRFGNVTDAENNETLGRRIDFLLRAASVMEADTLILGAFGCGVFGQDARTVMPHFIVPPDCKFAAF